MKYLVLLLIFLGGDDQESFAQSGSMSTQYGTTRPFYRLIKTDERVWIRFKADGGNSNHRGFVAGYVLYYSGKSSGVMIRFIF